MIKLPVQIVANEKAPDSYQVLHILNTIQKGEARTKDILIVDAGGQLAVGEFSGVRGVDYQVDKSVSPPRIIFTSTQVTLREGRMGERNREAFIGRMFIPGLMLSGVYNGPGSELEIRQRTQKPIQ